MTWDDATIATVGARIAQARRDNRALDSFPGPLPPDLNTAYRVQQAALDAMGAKVAGWKAAGVAPEWRERIGAMRVFGPVLDGTVFEIVMGQVTDMPVIVGGYAAFEAELIARVGEDAPADMGKLSSEEVFGIVEAVHVGAEFAGSPIAVLPGIGPLASVAAFASNAGLAVGPAIDRRRFNDLEAMRFVVSINGMQRSAADAGTLSDSIAQIVADTIAAAAERGLSVREGDYISTGAIGGPHRVLPGDEITLLVDNATLDPFRFRVVAQK